MSAVAEQRPRRVGEDVIVTLYRPAELLSVQPEAMLEREARIALEVDAGLKDLERVPGDLDGAAGAGRLAAVGEQRIGGVDHDLPRTAEVARRERDRLPSIKQALAIIAAGVLLFPGLCIVVMARSSRFSSHSLSR